MPHVRRFQCFGKRLRTYAIARVGIGILALPPNAHATQVDIDGPLGSVAFGTAVAALPNGNFVVTDPLFESSAVGAVYLYSPSGTMISTLTGSNPDDHVGSGGLVVVGSSNFVVLSPDWNNVGAPAAGAVTWVNGTTGLAGQVSASNSLVGTTDGDKIGSNDDGVVGVFVLHNGNYVVASPFWNNGVAGSNVGAATWGNGNGGIAGPVSESNSLVGTTAGDNVAGYVGGNTSASLGVLALSNGNFVVESPRWNNGVPDSNVGAATWGDGGSGITGPVSENNSLVGTSTGDHVSLGRGSAALTNGNYVIASPDWNNGVSHVGAATWGSGSIGIVGPVTAGNSLIGTTAADSVSSNGVTALANGNYVVASMYWNSTGAATWGNGSSGVTGAVSASNSLVGTSFIDQVGERVYALSNGNYVVGSPVWKNGTGSRLGAATFGNGTSGIKGAVSVGNSLYGTSDPDFVGSHVTALSNGNYVVESPWWNAGTPDSSVGAVTWGNGSVGVKGAVSASNSLVGTTYGDNVGLQGVVALSNGNYVVNSGLWSNGMPSSGFIGAATWGKGSTGITGPVSTSNSLTGTNSGYYLGAHALHNGNYVIASPDWNDAQDSAETGAATWGSGLTGIAGPVSSGNSLTGTRPGDRVGFDGYYGLDAVAAFSDGNFVVISTSWNGRGAITLANDRVPLKGTIQPSNSVLGTTPFGGTSMVHAYDPLRHVLVVGRPADNIVTLVTDQIFGSGFEPSG